LAGNDIDSLELPLGPVHGKSSRDLHLIGGTSSKVLL